MFDKQSNEIKGRGGRRLGAGRPKGATSLVSTDVRMLAMQYGPAAVKKAARLAGLVDGGEGEAESEQARIAALSIILDRAYGKPSQSHIVQGDENKPLRSVIELVIVDPSPRPQSIPPPANKRPV